MNIIEQNYKWNGSLSKRLSTKYIILHHRAGNGDVQSIHQTHLANGWSGIGYHFYVRKDGTVYRGRPLEMVGAHCKEQNQNYQSVGICFEGNYSTEKTMPDKQLQAGKELVLYLKAIYINAEIKKHSDFMATACPGQYFPFDEIKAGKAKKELTSANDIIWELMHGKLKVEISDVDRAVDELDKARRVDGSLYWILRKIVNK